MQTVASSGAVEFDIRIELNEQTETDLEGTKDQRCAR